MNINDRTNYGETVFTANIPNSETEYYTVAPRNSRPDKFGIFYCNTEHVESFDFRKSCEMAAMFAAERSIAIAEGK